ncbi:hypothetical protein [Thermoflexus sp.]|uniref:hypothetical protein n=1 Tax=Thermoflexus sp. TaxID=1969742 RepID=UPI0025FAD76B|nr:hypothetical protein [Thermoflexus sp.]MCS7352176.1 hypothetical protein [Thermoflexus sp.]MCX7690873.1 hypothetical protein [Thermoflexus sp.]MDW8181637.1 hypothetical protein [Anaerolineae bacterium]
MASELRVNLNRVQEDIRHLRAWRKAWDERCQVAIQTAQALAETVRAAPGREFAEAVAAGQQRWRRVGERVEALAQTLEQALARLEAAFREAASLLPAEFLRGIQLPTLPLAIGPDGQRLSSQFDVRIPIESIRWDWIGFIDTLGVSEQEKQRLKAKIQALSSEVDIGYNLACGWVALSMALSRQTQTPIPVQAVIGKALSAHPEFRMRVIRNLTEDLRLNRSPEANASAGMFVEQIEKDKYVDRALVTTSPEDLIAVAREFEVEAERFWTPQGDRQPEWVWEHLKARMERGEDVIALVNSTGSNYREGPIPNRVPGTDLRFSDGDVRESLPPGGRLRPWQESGVPHWVAINRLEERDGQRFVVVNNPFNNRAERYRWEDFLEAIDEQVRDDPQWWFVSIRRKER